MSQQVAIDTLVDALVAVPEYDNPLIPIYKALGQEQPAQSVSTKLSGPTELGLSKGPLTLSTIRQHSQLLHDQTDLAQDQTFTVNSVIQSCQRIPPTPLTLLPLGF
jgi:hypothetical protein